MASGQIAGSYFGAAGKNPNNYRTLGEGSSVQFDDTLGGTSSLYVNGVDKPVDTGVVLRVGDGPHIFEGENFYLGVKSTTQDGVDSDDTLAVLHFWFRQYNADGTEETILFERVAQRNTTVSLGGLADDPFVNVDYPALVYAFGPVPAGSSRTWYGPTRADVRDDTA